MTLLGQEEKKKKVSCPSKAFVGRQRAARLKERQNVP